jgi:hypothetical protein
MRNLAIRTANYNGNVAQSALADEIYVWIPRDIRRCPPHLLPVLFQPPARWRFLRRTGHHDEPKRRLRLQLFTIQTPTGLARWYHAAASESDLHSNIKLPHKAPLSRQRMLMHGCELLFRDRCYRKARCFDATTCSSLDERNPTPHGRLRRARSTRSCHRLQLPC